MEIAAKSYSQIRLLHPLISRFRQKTPGQLRPGEKTSGARLYRCLFGGRNFKLSSYPEKTRAIPRWFGLVL
jgi:hypothetical protein